MATTTTPQVAQTQTNAEAEKKISAGISEMMGAFLGPAVANFKKEQQDVLNALNEQEKRINNMQTVFKKEMETIAEEPKKLIQQFIGTLDRAEKRIESIAASVQTNKEEAQRELKIVVQKLENLVKSIKNVSL